MQGSSSSFVRWVLKAMVFMLVGAGGFTRAEANPIEPLYTIGYVISNPYPDADPAPVNPYSLMDGQYSAYTDGNRATLLDNAIPGLDPAHFTKIAPLPGDTATWAMTINGLGHVVGSSTIQDSNSWVRNWQLGPGDNHAYYFSRETGTLALQTLNGTLGIPMGINDSDQVVGESYIADGSLHGFITRPGFSAVDLNSVIAPGSGYTLLAGLAIDNDGNIRTAAKDAEGNNYYIELRPISGLDPSFPSQPSQNDPPVYVDPPASVPEPTTLIVLAVAGLTRLGNRRWSRLRSA